MKDKDQCKKAWKIIRGRWKACTNVHRVGIIEQGDPEIGTWWAVENKMALESRTVNQDEKKRTVCIQQKNVRDGNCQALISAHKKSQSLHQGVWRYP